jgi:hypothetical protein
MKHTIIRGCLFEMSEIENKKELLHEHSLWIIENVAELFEVNSCIIGRHLGELDKNIKMIPNIDDKMLLDSFEKLGLKSIRLHTYIVKQEN